MNSELLQVIEQIGREKGIGKDVLIETLESALVSATRKKFGVSQPIEVKIDSKTGEIDIRTMKKVVEVVQNEQEEISLEEARRHDPTLQVDDAIGFPITFEGFGRIAAQTAKQVIVQRVKKVEQEIVYNEFKKREGTLVNGMVLRHEKGNYVIDLGRTEGVIPPREQAPRESYKRGDRLRALVLEVRMAEKGPQIILSRSHPTLVARLFEMEVPEIYEGIIEVKNVVREAGDRTKIAVASKDSAVDPVGACVGMKGSRVQAVVRELRGEKIDIIPWVSDPKALIAKALSPAVVEKVAVDEEARTALVVVSDSQLSLAIGKKGQNVRLAAKLTGWKIDILSQTEYETERAKELGSEIEAAITRETRKEAEAAAAAAGEAGPAVEPTEAPEEAGQPPSEEIPAETAVAASEGSEK